MTQSTAKPLSEKPLGYILAAAGGILGGPIGIIASLAVIFALSKIMVAKDGKNPNRFLVWAAVGVIGAPLSLVPFMGGSPQETGGGGSGSQTTEASKKQSAVVPVGVAESVRGDRSLTVTGSNAMSSIRVSNQFMDPIESKGGQLIAVYMTISNTGKESGNMFWTSFDLEDSQGRKYDSVEDFADLTTLNMWIEEQGLASSGDQLFPGASAQTVAVFRVAPDAQGLRLVVNENRYFAID
jgi:hypothetical protein